MSWRSLFFMLCLAGCDQHPQTYAEQQADICLTKGGEPISDTSGFSGGVGVGCYFKKPN